MSRRAQKKGEPEPLLDWQLDEIREAFNLFDADATGQISYHEMRAAMRALNYNPKKAELRVIVEEADPGLVGYIDFEGFLKIMSKHARTVNRQDEVDSIFALFADGSKTISLSALRDAAKEIGENMTADELESIVETLGGKSAGINQEAFRRIMLPKEVGDDLGEVDD